MSFYGSLKGEHNPKIKKLETNLMDDAKQQLADKLKSSNNILVTVSRDPSVDQLASCIGLTLLLNKQGKHAAAVFSGKVPSTLEFLQPDETIEKNTDSLRDFIISLDKSKADKLRYKVEEDVVRIFITPYKTSLSEADLEFSEGDFNVDVVVALGVHMQEDLDEAITAHGRILHDATVASINTSPDGGMGSIAWHDPQASSLSELVTDLAQAMEGDLLDEQIATALLTGIVSETERFSNDKTSSQTMSVSAALMTAGANQQLVATKLEEPEVPEETSDEQSDDASAEENTDEDKGIIEIDHSNDPPKEDSQEDFESNDSSGEGDGQQTSEEQSPDSNNASSPAPEPAPAPDAETNQITPADNLITGVSPGAKLVTDPPTMGGTLTANSEGEHLDPVTDPFSMPTAESPQMLDRNNETTLASTPPTDSQPPAGSPEPAAPALTPAPAAWTPPSQEQINTSTLSDLEQAVKSPHVDPANIDTMRDEVSRALTDNAADAAVSSEPIEALNAQPFGNEDLHGSQPTAPPLDSAAPPQFAAPSDATASTPPAFNPATPADPQAADPSAPPPVPPPIPFQFGNPASPQ